MSTSIPTAPDFLRIAREQSKIYGRHEGRLPPLPSGESRDRRSRILEMLRLSHVTDWDAVGEGSSTLGPSFETLSGLASDVTCEILSKIDNETLVTLDECLANVVFGVENEIEKVMYRSRAYFVYFAVLVLRPDVFARDARIAALSVVGATDQKMKASAEVFPFSWRSPAMLAALRDLFIGTPAAFAALERVILCGDGGSDLAALAREALAMSSPEAPVATPSDAPRVPPARPPLLFVVAPQRGELALAGETFKLSAGHFGIFLSAGQAFLARRPEGFMPRGKERGAWQARLSEIRHRKKIQSGLAAVLAKIEEEYGEPLFDREEFRLNPKLAAWLSVHIDTTDSATTPPRLRNDISV